MNKNELKNGAVVELRDGSICVKIDDMFHDIKNGETINLNFYKETLIYNHKYDVVKLNNTSFGLYRVLTENKWTEIRHEEILTDSEKRYLSAVIKPFRERVESIYKQHNKFGYYIQIRLKTESINLPTCKKDTMYKGMKIAHFYSLRELGL